MKISLVETIEEHSKFITLGSEGIKALENDLLEKEFGIGCLNKIMKIELWLNYSMLVLKGMKRDLE